MEFSSTNNGTARICEIGHLETSTLSAEEQQEASMMANLLEAIRTDGNTLCQCRRWSTDRHPLQRRGGSQRPTPDRRALA